MKTRKRVTITTPFGTPEETAKVYKLSKRRTKEIRDMVNKGLAKRGYILVHSDTSSVNRNGAGHFTSAAARFKTKVKVELKRDVKTASTRRAKSKAK